jgi:predicted O-methyltransferase YrrM
MGSKRRQAVISAVLSEAYGVLSKPQVLEMTLKGIHSLPPESVGPVALQAFELLSDAKCEEVIKEMTLKGIHSLPPESVGPVALQAFELLSDAKCEEVIKEIISRQFQVLSWWQIESIIRHVNDIGQSKMDPYSSLPTGTDSIEVEYPFPVELRRFESLYDKHSGNWQVPYPTVKIQVHDKKLYPRLMADSIELETGHFFYALVKLLEPSLILETGVSRGYSTCCIASALKVMAMKAHVYCVDPVNYPHLWEGTDLESYITWIPKVSQDCLPDVQGMEFDLLVIDSHHDYKTCQWELSNFERLLKPGGYILMHDSLHYDGVGAVVHQLQTNPRFELVTLPSPRGKVDDIPRNSGLTVVRKIRSGEPSVEFDPQYKDWFWGDTSEPPFLWRIEKAPDEG